MKIIAIIPAHLNSIRFPRKILLKIQGLEMIEHVRRRALLCELFEEVYVATQDEEIANLVESHGGKVIRTKNIHLSGTSRIIEACKVKDATHIVLVQGDEPLILPDHLKKICHSIIQNPLVDAWNATADLSEESLLRKKSIVKCVINKEGRILLCFRGEISFSSFKEQQKYIKKILGLIAFRKDMIMKFENYKPSNLEASESIEQLRFIENDVNLQSVLVNPALPSINEYEDEKIVLDYIQNNSIQQNLLNQILM